LAIPDGVVVVPHHAAEEVLELLATYDEKESKMMTIIQREKSIIKAIEIYNRLLTKNNQCLKYLSLPHLSKIKSLPS
jgi:hypothetical protein